MLSYHFTVHVGSPPLEPSKPCLLDANTSVSGHSCNDLLSTSKEGINVIIENIAQTS